MNMNLTSDEKLTNKYITYTEIESTIVEGDQTLECRIHDYPLYFACPDLLVAVCEMSCGVRG
jgi:hypothetical protein